MRSESTSGRLHEFDVLRAISIVLLLFHHSDLYGLPVFGYSIEWLAPYVGTLLLGFFFFSAGYFMAVSLQKNENKLLVFFKTRFIRIYPPYLFALLLFIVILGETLHRFDLLAYIFDLQIILSNFIKPLLTLWYVGAIAIYYLFFGLILRYIKSDWGVIAISLGLFVVTYLIRVSTGAFDNRFFEYYFVFLMGIFLGKSGSLKAFLYSKRLIWLKLLLAALGVLALSLRMSPNLNALVLLDLAAINAFILSWAFFFLGIFSLNVGVLKWRLWNSIAIASYFAYLLHRPFWQIMLTPLGSLSGSDQLIFKFFPGAFIILFVCYFLQKGYDLVVRKLRLV